jgi:F-type H+-transporting ATPase subunit alpha
MHDYNYYLEKSGEIGYVDQVVKSIVYAHGLPTIRPGEMVIFEGGQIGYILGINKDSVEILLLSPEAVVVGAKLTRTLSGLKVKVDETYLGKTITSLDFEKNLFVLDEDPAARPVDKTVMAFSQRQKITDPVETGVSLVDLVVPIGKGQRELVIGDRKTGKSQFLLQTVKAQAKRDYICVYALIAKPLLEIQRVKDYFKAEGLEKNSVIVASHSIDRPGLVFLTPYVAMTIAEYFRDQGKDVLLILDDLTTHARYYREVMLLAKRFPGRSSYPGDIFYVHARLIERAGKFTKGSITCFPVAQSVLSDLSGYIQSNLMSMTDGHILFDNDLFDQGRRPAINPFLSVTRVGGQTQSALVKEVSRSLRTTLVSFEKVKQFKHFQTELSEATRNIFDLGSRLVSFMDQLPDIIVPVPINVIIFSGLMAGIWRSSSMEDMKKEMILVIETYNKDDAYRKAVDTAITETKKLDELINKVNTDESLLLKYIQSNRKAAADSTPPAPETPPVPGAPAAPDQPAAPAQPGAPVATPTEAAPVVAAPQTLPQAKPEEPKGQS